MFCNNQWQKKIKRKVLIQRKLLQCLNVKAGRQCLKLHKIKRINSSYGQRFWFICRWSMFSQQLWQAVSEKPRSQLSDSAAEENRRKQETLSRVTRHTGQRLQTFVIWLKRDLCCCCCWSFLYSAILRSRADSLRSHVFLHEWLTFYSAFLNIHRSVGHVGRKNH